VNLPHGTVTFLFTDIEGSTKLAERLGPAYGDLLETHRRLLRHAFAGGVEISTEGDSFFYAFEEAAAAVRAAVAGQRALAEHDWPADSVIRVRMGLHTGHADVHDGGYVGVEVHRAARIGACGHGGQVLLSEATHALTARQLPAEVSELDLGPHRLKDLSAPERLYQLVIRGLPSAFPPLRTLDERRTNLPVQVTSFIGREREVGELTALTGANRLVTVLGVGGTGKTRLALHVAGELLEQHPDGAWLVELAPITAPDQVAREVARSLSVQEEPGRSLEDTLVDFLRLKRLLLVLDNCEHLVGAVAQLVDDLFRGAPGLVILATSREALGIAGERVFQVPSLALPPAVAESHADVIDQVAAADAVRLFVDRATAVAPSFELTADNAAAVAEICRRLDGIPLAIELAAARVTFLSVEDIATRLEDRFRLLTGGSRTALPRQQTLQALIDWSWDLLEDEDRRLLRRLAVFTGGATLDAATAVTGKSEFDTLDGIGRLVHRSLVIADRGAPTRYRLLETIRQYGRERLIESGEAVAMRDVHLRHYRQMAERAAPELRGPGMAEWLRLLDDEIENLRSAIDWGFETDLASALRICVAIERYWRSRVAVEGYERMQRGVALMDTANAPEIEPALGSRAFGTAANMAWMTGNAAFGRPWAERAVKLSEVAGDEVARYEALVSLALSKVFTDDFEGVPDILQEALILAEAHGDWQLVGYTVGGMAESDAERGDMVGARALLDRAARAAERSGNPAVIAFVALGAGRVSSLSGDLAEARLAFGRAIADFVALDDPRLELVSRSDLAHALRAGGEIAEAEAMYRRTLHDWLHAGNRGAIANQLESFAYIALEKGDAPRAARLLGAAESIREAASAAMLPHERSEYEAAVRRLHADAVKGAVVEVAWGEGRRLSIDQAVAIALAKPVSSEG
jgi:predicted ATPase/class 3 adenylate cyclase